MPYVRPRAPVVGILGPLLLALGVIGPPRAEAAQTRLVLKNFHDNLCLASHPGDFLRARLGDNPREDSRARVGLYNCSKGNNQVWYFTPTRGAQLGELRTMGKPSGPRDACLTRAGNGVKVEPCENRREQLWHRTTTQSGLRNGKRFMVDQYRNDFTATCLGAWKTGRSLGLYPCTGANRLWWTVKG